MRLSPAIVPALVLAAIGLPAAEPPRRVHVVANFHPASCGWLTDWSTERNYCANSYLDHLDRVRDDPHYRFALSECNNLIAIMNFAPHRVSELKQRIAEGRVELVNAFFLEPTINLSGGEALVKMGVEGLRWQQQLFGVRPRLSWMIDVTGTHQQMAQIVAGLGLDALVYCRLNPTGSTVHWLQSPDGTRTLALSPGHYLEWRSMFGAKAPLEEKQLRQLADDLRARIEPPPPEQDRKRPDAADLKSPPRRTPPGTPVLVLGGSGDYNLAPVYRNYPQEFLRQFRQAAPEFEVEFSTPSRYLDELLPAIRSGRVTLPTMRGGTAFTYNAFWIQNPRVKTWFRRCEQQLQAAEMLATAASLQRSWSYPVQPLYHAWLQLLLNMDRNTLWGAAGGMVFEHPHSWDARDRFESIERLSREAFCGAARALAGPGQSTLLFNPLNWRRGDVARLPHPLGADCQPLPGGDVLCRLDLPSVGLAAPPAGTPAPARSVPLPPVIETRHYRARIGAGGELESLVLKPSGREVLGGPANLVVAEEPLKKHPNPADHMVDRPGRRRLADSAQSPATLAVQRGALATVVTAESAFVGGGKLRRMTVLYHDQPRIDFETELNDLPDRSVVLAEFPLAAPVREVRRGIPYGFSHAAGAVPDPALPEVAQGISPAVRWSHYQMEGAGVALLDQGTSGREIVDRTPVIYLYNAAQKYRGYPNPWLSGDGRHVLRYALLAHDGDFAAARVPHHAWEFNVPPLLVDGCRAADPASWLDTSDNVIVEALRRDGDQLELRLAECVGRPGLGRLTLNLPHRGAALTDLAGGRPQPLAGGPEYEFPLRPQQIVTLRFAAPAAVPAVQPLTAWDELVPPAKRQALRRYLPDVKGHPPAGGP